MPIKKTITSKSTTSLKKSPSSKKERVISKSKKKTKSIIIDIIEDEPENVNLNFIDDDQENYHEKNLVNNLKRGEALVQPTNEALDLQKEFFAGFSKTSSKEEAINKNLEKNTKYSVGPRKVTLYRNLVIKFLILVGILAAVVFYFSFSKLTISLDLRSENINNSLLLKIVDATTKAAATSTPENEINDPREEISGLIKEVEVSSSKTYSASGESNLGEEIRGQVRIINNYNKSQTLVATTRLLSTNGELFRIKEAVTVLAGGEVTVEIYADKPERALAINPTSFTIPGLWLGLQDKIYAESDEAFTFSKKTEKYVTTEDLESASQNIKEVLLEEAKNKAEAQLSLPADYQILYSNEGASIVNFGAKRGDKVNEFTVTATSRITVVAFPTVEVNKLALAKLNLIMPDDKEILDFKTADIKYNLETYDALSGVASVKAKFNAAIILKKNAELINPEQLVNLKAAQIEAYLKEQTEVKDYQLKFYPAFIKKAPGLVDRIKIEINK